MRLKNRENITLCLFSPMITKAIKSVGLDTKYTCVKNTWLRCHHPPRTVTWSDIYNIASWLQIKFSLAVFEGNLWGEDSWKKNGCLPATAACVIYTTSTLIGLKTAMSLVLERNSGRMSAQERDTQREVVANSFLGIVMSLCVNWRCGLCESDSQYPEWQSGGTLRAGQLGPCHTTEPHCLSTSIPYDCRWAACLCLTGWRVCNQHPKAKGFYL